MRLRTTGVTAAAAALTLTLPMLPAQASHSWNGYHWARTTSSFALLTGDNVDSSWDSYLQTAASDWSKSTVLDLNVVGGLTTPRKCRPTSGRIEVCNASYGNNGWLGIAQISVSGSHITQGIAKMNDSYFTTTQYNNPNERLHVMCQEVGHTFGLDHQSETGTSLDTCMDYFSNTGTNATSALSTHPNKHDYDELTTIYAHLDSSSTVSSSAASSRGNAAYSDDRTAWGREVARSANGDRSTFIRDFGDEAVITEVVWAR